jgi:hypothetical protein
MPWVIFTGVLCSHSFKVCVGINVMQGHGLKIFIFAAWSFGSLICWIWLCRTKLLRAGVHFLSQPVVDGTTGTVIVLTTPDAQRTMLSYQVRLSRYFFR